MKKMKVWKKSALCLALAGTLFFNSLPAWAEVFEGESSGEELADFGEYAPGFSSEETGGFEDESVREPEASEAEGFEGEALSGFCADGKGTEEEAESTGEPSEETMTEEEKERQLAPIRELTPISYVENPESCLEGDTGSVGAGRAGLPARYDTRGSLSTPVKNQNPSNMCWAYTLAANLELSLQGKNLGVYDLSEEHLAYFFANRVNDPLGNTPNDRNQVLHHYRQGGNQTLGAIFLSTWSGMALESQVPYITNEEHTWDSAAIPSGQMAYQAAAYLKNAVFTDYSVSRIKNLIAQYGSVSLSFQMYDQYYNPETCAYSYPVSDSGANHAVTLVGWDDSYSRDNFLAASGVKANGAWIAKNSWGSEWGDEGYFYISYENTSNYSMVAAEADTASSYRNNYFYDGSCALSKLRLYPSGSGGISSVANIFTANAGKGKGEALGEVVLAAYTDGGTYEIQIYTNLTDKDDPTSGVPAYSTPVRYYQPYAGITTVRVPEVTLMQGTLYSVVVTNTGAETIEYLCETDSTYDWVQFRAGLSAQQSYYYSKSQGWSDFAKSGSMACARIKVHTRTLSGAITVPVPSGVRTEGKSYKQVAVSWNPAAGVSGYEIYRKASGGSYAKIGTVSYRYNTFTDKKAVLGTKYAYKVRSYSVVNGQAVYSGYSGAVSGKAALGIPKVSVKVSASLLNKVTWNKISGAQGYIVYRRTTGGWKKLAQLNGSAKTTYTDKKITSCTSYEYMVRAYRTVNKKQLKSGFQSSGRYRSAPAVQRVSSVANSSKGLKVRWSPQKKCDGYRIYRKEGSGRWTGIAVIKKGETASYLDKTAKKGKKYAYRVRAYVKEPYGTVYSKYKTSGTVRKK